MRELRLYLDEDARDLSMLGSTKTLTLRLTIRSV